MAGLYAKDAFAGKVALVTGGTSGIGEGTAKAYAECGASVMITGRNEANGARIVGEIEAAGGTAAFVSGDVTESAFAGRLVAATAERFGALNVLFNNAGKFTTQPFDEITDELWHEILDVNLNAQFYMARAAVKQMKVQGKGGAIVNMSSESGLICYPQTTLYGVSKRAVNHLTQGMAADLAGDHIRVNAVNPGDVDTPMHYAVWSGTGLDEKVWRKMAAQNVPLGRVSSIEDVANAVLYLSSGGADNVTGVLLSIDGGTTVIHGWEGGEE
jgi:NAD(P)-dependent dehydrogenase (short-subunit alcohol dehydrogenase family)